MVKKYILTASFLVFIFIYLSMTALAADNVEWIEKQSSVKLYWGDSVTVEEYVIKAEDFSNDTVFISISKDGEKLMTSPLSAGMDIAYDDKIKIYAQSINPNYETVTINGKEFKKKSSNPYAELSISIPGEPKFDIQITTEKDTYDCKSQADGKIDVSISATNSGDAEAKNIVLTVDTAGLELLKGKAEYRYTELSKSKALKLINLTLETPAPWEDTDFNISAKITCLDIKNKKYEYESSKIVKVEKKWDLVVSKAFPRDRYIGETIPVSITVLNTGLCNLDNILLNDSITSGMHLQENMTLNKTLSLKSGEKAEKILKYTLIPEKPGEFTFPQCIATFTLPNGQRKEISSDSSGNVIISGPDITVTKTVDKQELNLSDTLNVKVTAQNNGDTTVNLKMNDTLPPGAKLLSGNTSSKQILKSGGNSMSINYTLQMIKEGEITLPACKVNFYDLAKNSGEISSNTPVVHVETNNTRKENSTTAESNTTIEKTNESSQEVNKSSEKENKSSEKENKSSDLAQNESTENDNNTPGFDFVPTSIGLLMVAWLLIKKSV
jgi:uncharacterized repeat protein (TIGR01451 family)